MMEIDYQMMCGVAIAAVRVEAGAFGEHHRRAGRVLSSDGSYR
jgi:hypothetical protein